MRAAGTAGVPCARIGPPAVVSGGAVPAAPWWESLPIVADRPDCLPLEACLVPADPLIDLLARAEHALQAGLWTDARLLLESALRRAPRHAPALVALGHALLNEGDAAAAIRPLRRAVATAPALPAAHGTLSMALSAQGQHAEAMASAERASRLAPADTQAWLTLGRVRLAAGEARPAIEAFATAARTSPDDPEGWFSAGVAWQTIGDLVQAEQAWSQALAVAEGHLPSRLNRASALVALDAADRALADYDRALAAAPDFARAHHGRGNALHALGRLDEACAAYARAVALDPDDPELRYTLADQQLQLGEIESAIAGYRAALARAPAHAQAAQNLLYALNYSDAVDALTVASEHRRLAGVAAGEASAQSAIRSPTEAGGVRAKPVAVAAPGDASDTPGGRITVMGAASTSPPPSSSIPRPMPAPSAAPAAPAALMVPRAPTVPTTPATGIPTAAPTAVMPRAALTPSPDPAPAAARAPAASSRTPLRVGFVSADLRTHSVAWFLLPLLRALDPRRVQAVGYANGGREDAMTDRLRSACTGWRRIDSMTDSQVVGQVRADGIDLLIDLSGHSAGHRLGVFAQRAAPLQATWLGYPNTTGLATVDLRLVDAITDPLDTAQALASERLLRIEGGFLCYRAPDDAPEPRPRDAHAPPTFGSFNNLQKISPSTVDLWAAVLSAEPEASLLLKAGGLEQASVQARLQAAFASRGIAPARLCFLPRTAGVAEHLAAYGEIDVALDTWPYHGTTTTCEAMWMGVPVITRVGDRHASRVGASLLTAAGCAEDVAGDTAGFVGAARRALARVRSDTQSRAALRARLAASALTDAAGFADRFTRALEQAWAEARARG